ncbi:MAG: hypothetical protein QME64_05030 [bacterium]|nr:hypothetical protein [bacterium]
MIKRLIILVFLVILVVSSYGLNVEGIIDVYPAGFVADKSTPFAIHFVCWTTAFQPYTTVSAKLQIQSGIMSANNYTWSTAGGLAVWRKDSDGISLHNPMPVSSSTVSGWLFGISSSITYFGASSCKVRLYRPGSSFPHDISTSVLLYAWNTTTDAGWIEGIHPQIGAKIIVLAKDGSGKIMGSYITENNHIDEQPTAYPTTTGYFKLGVPVGVVHSLEFRNLNNQGVGTLVGPWTITAGKITDVGSPTLVNSREWKNY